ncbi:MAG: PAS domain S-box protein [Proteobacteria bacterium]|nr:PAS domain S-box protein [Pseudomonadota bacterium]
MARKIAANAHGRLLPASGLAKSMAQPGYERLVRADPWIHRAVSVLIVIFLSIVGASGMLQLTSAREEVISAHRGDIELMAALANTRLKLANPQLDAQWATDETVAALLPAGTMAGGQRLLLLAGDGRVLRSAPVGIGHVTFIDEVIIGPLPLLTFAERAGVETVRLARGGEALATVRKVLNTSEPEANRIAYVAVLEPMDSVLAQWVSRTQTVVTLFITLAGVVAALGAAFYVQSTRARYADRMCSDISTRVDSALSDARCGLWDWDIARGRFFWSDSMYALIGYERTGDLISLVEITALMNRQDGNLLDIADQLLADDLATVEHEFRMRHASGHWVWLRARLQMTRDVDPAAPRITGVVLDVTEQKRFAEETRRADQRLSAAIDSISEAFVLWDAGGCLVLCNANFRAMYGFDDCRDLRGMSYEVLTGSTPADGQQRERQFERQLASGRWLQVSERRTEDGGFVSVGTDITARKQNEARLMESERRLMTSVASLTESQAILEAQKAELRELAGKLDAQRMAAEAASRAKTEFLANMSHELRTPLNAIIGFADVMQHRLFGALGSDKYEGYVADILQSGRGLLSIIDDILEMSRIEAGTVALHCSDMSVIDLAQAVMSGVRADAGAKNITLSLDAPRDGQIFADPHALRHALNQLLRNAVKFTPTGGAAVLRVRRAGSGVNIFVGDNGCGIAPEHLSRFGRPFEILTNRIENGNKGSGLGVAIAKSLVGLHGGSIRVRSCPGTGTLVMVHLPLIPEDFPVALAAHQNTLAVAAML